MATPDSSTKTAFQNSVTLEAIGLIADESERIIARLQDVPNDEADRADSTGKKYTITEVARMLNKTADGIRKVEKQGKLEAPALKDNGRRSPYSLQQINAMREYWDCRPGRAEGDDPIRFSFQNFKGGVGKTTLACHCAQYLARAGYRVLLVDCDSQGSSTVTFGYHPDADIEGDDTLLPYLTGDQDSLEYAVRSTHWDGLDLIPANLDLYSAEYYLAAMGRDGGGDWISRLDQGLATVENAYDIVLIDPPPALGMISLSVLRALDGLIVPTPPAMYDFHSTGSFFRMLEEVMETVGKHLGAPVELDFVKILVSKHISGRQAHEFVRGLMAESYGNNVLLNPFVQSAEIDNASSEWKTVYDLEGPTSSRQTYRRCLESMDAVFFEVSELIEAVWQARRSERKLSLTMPASAAREDLVPAESM